MVCSINDLPTEVITIIFKCIPKERQLCDVNKLWMNLFFEICWDSVHLKTKADSNKMQSEIAKFDIIHKPFFPGSRDPLTRVTHMNINNDVVVPHISRFVNVEYLKITLRSQINQPFAGLMGERRLFSNIKDVAIYNYIDSLVLEQEFIKSLLTGVCGDQLTRLYIKPAWIFISDEALMTLCEYAPRNLHDLSFTASNSWKCIRTFFETFSSQLKTLKMDGCYILDADSIKGLQFPNLEALNLTCQYQPNATELDDCFMSRLASASPYLSKLYMFGYDQITNRGIASLVLRHNMKHLTLAKCVKLTDHALRLISEFCISLEAFKIETNGLITNVGIDAMLKSCVALKSVEIWWCPGVKPLFDTEYNSNGILQTTLRKMYIVPKPSDEWIEGFHNFAPNVTFN